MTRHRAKTRVVTVWIPKPTTRETCAVIVSYHPDEGFAERVARIAPQVGRVIVVDNASPESILARLRALETEKRIELIALPENVGIAGALNRGLERAVESGFTWALTLDDDSTVFENLVEGLIAVFDEYPHRDTLAILGANYEEEATGETGTQPRRKVVGSALEVDQVITSGCLQSLAVYRDIGPYREDLFMYFVDNEYCGRARVAGYRVVLSLTPLMRHRTGNQARHHLGPFTVTTANYAAWRYYYVVRNGIAVSRDYLTSDPKGSARRLYNIAKRSAAALVFEEDRPRKLTCMLRGAKDGVLGKMGKVTF
jgi:rhamnosyltransferase